jgi:hypothetical protein
MSICSTAAPRHSDSPGELKPLAVTIQTAQKLIGIKNTKIVTGQVRLHFFPQTTVQNFLDSGI